MTWLIERQIAHGVAQQTQILFDAMTPDQQQQVLEAQAKRNALQAVLQRKFNAKIGAIAAFVVLAFSILGNVPTDTTARSYGVLVLLALVGVGCWLVYERTLRNIVRDAEAAGLIPKNASAR